MATALTSLLSGVPVDRYVAMTGELTLRGKVLPIGGVKEKILAAFRFGLKTVILPKENEKDLAEIPEAVGKEVSFLLVDDLDEVLEKALVRPIPELALGKEQPGERTGDEPVTH